MSPRRPQPRTPGWVKLGTGLAVIGAEITESVLHPVAAEGLAIADAAIPLIVGLILFTTIVLGTTETVDRIFRLLRWVTNRPEPTAPPANPAPSAGNDLIARQAATLHEFDVPPEQGLTRAQASAAFRKHGLDPRAMGFWVRAGYLAREGDRRWLTDKGREWADSKSGGPAAA
jgi:hypothetical protein